MLERIGKPKKKNRFELFFYEKTAAVIGFKSEKCGKSAFKITDSLKKLFEIQEDHRIIPPLF